MNASLLMANEYNDSFTSTPALATSKNSQEKTLSFANAFPVMENEDNDSLTSTCTPVLGALQVSYQGVYCLCTVVGFW